MTLKMRLLARMECAPDTGCWLWEGCTSDGYGIIGIGKSGIMRVHRASYEIHVGPIPEGMTLDHLCRVRNCMNPRHMEVVTRGENVLRGMGRSAQNARKTECVHGHEFTPENTYIELGSGKRSCRMCRPRKNRNYYHKHRQKILMEKRGQRGAAQNRRLV